MAAVTGAIPLAPESEEALSDALARLEREANRLYGVGDPNAEAVTAYCLSAKARGRLVIDAKLKADANTDAVANMIRAAEKTSNRPLITPHQLHNDVLPVLVADNRTRAIFREAAAVLGTAIVFLGIGYGASLWWAPLTCDNHMIEGRFICWRDNEPAPVDAVAAPPEPVPQPAAKPAITNGRH